MPQAHSREHAKEMFRRIEAIIAYIDEIFFGADTEMQMKIQSIFGFRVNSSNLALIEALRWYLWSWQELQPTTGSGTSFYRFCDALEVRNGVVAQRMDGEWIMRFPHGLDG
ncbi:hypothetical protein EDD85DRAFT_276017 [Armillaria nabsnona]|nr:hypothetical protein EDD85DRAFT_276017 [Armillaria nabsnona]